jgi:topoisomerase IA-like protein
MKVLKKKAWSLKFTCKGCKAELEAEPSDVRVGEFGIYDEFETRYYVVCPECSTSHHLNENKTPRDVLNGAKRD